MIYDLIVIGGGINGTGIAVDAAERGLSVALFEEKDLASATSSASSKLIHGGLRYLEQYEFRLVKESLAEREVVLKLAPHIVFPLRFILPHEPHLRPAWMIRIGLFMYDHLSKLVSLPKSTGLKFDHNSFLKPQFKKGFEYSDCWVDDARLVVLNGLQLVKSKGQLHTQTKVIEAKRENDLWIVTTKNNLTGETQQWQTKALVNAAGPWVNHIFKDAIHQKTPQNIRLVKGSHIVVPNINKQTKAYILQNKDKRIVFVIPWLDDFLIIGTTDEEYTGDPREVKISDNEINYLIDIHNNYFNRQISVKDMVWNYSGVRPLCDDDAHSAQKITRDYRLEMNDINGKAPLLSVFGGKLTTYRKLAEHAIDKLAPYFDVGQSRSEKLVLPGGDITNTRDNYHLDLLKKYTWLPEDVAKRYAKTYGSLTHKLLENCSSLHDLGAEFGHTLYEAELKYLVKHEWANFLDDIIWRRTKLGMWLTDEEKAQITTWLNENHSAK